MIYLETGSVDPYYNLAFEELVLSRRTEGDYLILWQNDNTVVIGRNQNAEEEINRAFVDEMGIRVVRRGTGGGAVYHDLGNLNYSFITDLAEGGEFGLERFTVPVAEALKKLGLEAEVSGRNDILVSGKKVSGTAQRIVGQRILHHGTLLFRSNPDMVAGALRADPAKFRSKSTKSVRSRVGNIADYLPEEMTLKEFWDYIKAALAGGDFIPGALTEEEIQEVTALRGSKYGCWDWNFGTSPRYERCAKGSFPGGILECSVQVDKGGLVKDAVFRGDFLARRDVSEVSEALRSLPFRRDALESALASLPLEDYFGGITREEILNLMLQ